MKISKIYFDMDGVLADFNRGVKELGGVEPQEQKTNAGDDAIWEAIRNVPHFYDRLELMPGAPEMFRTLSEKYDVEILSGIPKPKRGILTAGEDKTTWAHRLLSADLKVNIVFWEQKKEYVTGPGCVLIDDLQRNIDEWTGCGGIGILYTSAADTLAEVSRIETL